MKTSDSAGFFFLCVLPLPFLWDTFWGAGTGTFWGAGTDTFGFFAALAESLHQSLLLLTIGRARFRFSFTCATWALLLPTRSPAEGVGEPSRNFDAASEVVSSSSECSAH